jgi:DNA-binding NtrC family response regulator
MKAKTKSPAEAGKHSTKSFKAQGVSATTADKSGPTETEETVSPGETTLIGCDKLPPLREVPEGFSLPAAALAFEARYISFALQTNAGSVTKAAKLLGISHQNLSLQLTQRHQALRLMKKPRAQRRDSTKG